MHKGAIRIWAGIIGVALTISMPFAGGSELLDGSFLSESCAHAVRPPQNTLQAVNAGLCLGFVSGVRDTMNLYDNSSTACWPSPLPARETSQVVMDYLKTAPEQLHYPASTLVRLALQRAYPCTPSGTP